MNSGVIRRTILVGEDDAEVRDYLAVTLRCHGYDVQLAADGEDVIHLFARRRSRLAVLLDIMMPNKDGWETLRDIRNDQYRRSGDHAVGDVFAAEHRPGDQERRDRFPSQASRSQGSRPRDRPGPQGQAGATRAAQEPSPDWGEGISGAGTRP